MATETIFFSYSRVDSDFALRLAKDLRKAGVALWMDQLDIKPGNHWDTSIENALDETSCILIILSPNSVISNNVMDEVSFALESGKKVIPVLWKECKIPFRLRRLQRIDFSISYEKGFNYLLNELNHLIKNLNNQTDDNEQFEFKERKQYNDEVDELLEKGKQHIEKLKATERESGTQTVERTFNTNSVKEAGSDVTQKYEGVLSKISTKTIRNIFYLGLFLYVVSFFLPMGNVKYMSSTYGCNAALETLGALFNYKYIPLGLLMNFSNIAMIFMSVFYFLEKHTWHLIFVVLGIISGLYWLTNFSPVDGDKNLLISPAYMVWLISQFITAFAFFVKTRKKRFSSNK